MLILRLYFLTKIPNYYFCFKTGLSALHIASFYGRYEFCRELLEQVSANLSSEEPNERAIFEDIKLEVRFISSVQNVFY